MVMGCSEFEYGVACPLKLTQALADVSMSSGLGMANTVCWKHGASAVIVHQSTCNCYRPMNCTCVAMRSPLVPDADVAADVAADAAAAARESCCRASSDNLLACMVTVRAVLLLLLLM